MTESGLKECLFRSKAIAKFGSAASLVANPLLLGCFDIVFLAAGTISFDKLTPVQQTQFIMLVVLLIRKGIRSVVAYQATGSLLEARKLLFGKEITSSKEEISSSVSSLDCTQQQHPKAI